MEITPLSEPISPMPAVSQKVHWPSVMQFAGSALAVGGLWSFALTLAVIGWMGRFRDTNLLTPSLQMFLLSTGMAAVGALILPSGYYSLRRLMGKPSQASPVKLGLLRPTLALLAVPLVLLAGHYVSRSETLNWLLLPPLHLLAIGLPVTWLVFLALRGLAAGSLQLRWGVFSAGLVLGPGLAFIVEVLLIFFGIVLMIVWFTTNIEAGEQFARLAQQLVQSPTPEELTRLLAPIILQPWVLVYALAFWAGLVPLVEEAVKPIGLWLLAGRQISPGAGFSAGVLCGAGFALMESLLLASQGDSWTFLVFARLGTGAVHTLSAGLTGWGLAQAWNGRHYLRLGVKYLGAVLLHGAWNCLSVLLALSSLTKVQTMPESAWIRMLTGIGSAAPYLLGSLALLSVLALAWINLKLRREEAAGNLRSKEFNGTDQLPG